MPGTGRGRARHPLAAFYFGSFRNNYVDDRPEKRYREMESFPGFEIDEIAARRFAKLTGEVNLPPIRFAEVGTPAFYLSYIRPAVFAGVMATDSAGRQQPSLLRCRARSSTSISPSRLRLPMVFSVGAAGGWADGHYRKTEWLASLKIM